MDGPNVCPICSGKGVYFKDGRNFVCSCQREENRAVWRRFSGLPEFVRRPLLPVTREYVEQYDRIRRSGANWICYSGRTGTGKSTQAFLIVDALLARRASVRAKVFNYPELARELSAYRFDSDRYESRLEDVLYPELIVLDDFLDAVPKPESFEEQIALDIVKRRYVQKKPLVITTEFTPSLFRSLMPRHGETLFGRVVEMCDGRLSVAGPDAKNYRLANY